MLDFPFMSVFKRLYAYIRPNRLRFFEAALAMAAVAALNGGVVYLLKPTVDYVFMHKDVHTLHKLLIAIPAVFLLKMVSTYTQNYLMNYVSQRAVQKLREDLFRHLHSLSLDFFWKSKSGDVLSRMTHDLARLQDGLQDLPLYAIRDGLTMVVLIGIMFWINWAFSLFALIAVPLVVSVLVVLGRKLRASARRSQEIMGEIAHRFQESLQGMTVIKAFNYEEYSILRFIEDNNSLFEQAMRYLRASALGGPLMEFLGSLIITGLVYVGGSRIISGGMTPGAFSTFLASFFAAYAPVKNLARTNATVQTAIAAAGRIFAILDEKPTVVEAPSPAVLPAGGARSVRLENASYKYPGQELWALRELDIDFEAGKVTAIAGSSGSGKTTLIHLLLRLFDPQEGRILIAGRDARDYSLFSLRQAVGLVTQETVLFNGTVLDNVAMGDTRASREKVEKSLELAGASEFVERLPQGLMTPLGERGMRLSGGQRQRLAIARAILKDPPILILDEATAHLDSQSERAVQKALETVSRGRTVIIVAHRLSTIQHADSIVVLRQGRLAEKGAHSELLGRGGVYATLYRLQQLEPEKAAAVPAETAAV